MTAAGDDTPGGFHHVPVLLDRVVELFSSVPAGVFVDGTVGGAGHSVAVLDANPGLHLLGLDRDPVAIAEATERVGRFGSRARIVRARFDAMSGLASDYAAELGLGVTGVLLDLGVSSPQFDRGERGFSYRHDAPLDMRMDPDQALSADTVVNDYDEAELAGVLFRHADERFSRRIAKAIVAARPVRSTGELAELVRNAIPAPARRRGGHPAKRTFQAIRIEVNGELAVLEATLASAVELLAPGGRAVVISYHSGEDRLVKTAFRTATTGDCTCPPGLPCVCGATPLARAIGRQGARPDADELARNPRGESARIRAIEKLAPEAEDPSWR